MSGSAAMESARSTGTTGSAVSAEVSLESVTAAAESTTEGAAGQEAMSHLGALLRCEDLRGIQHEAKTLIGEIVTKSIDLRLQRQGRALVDVRASHDISELRVVYLELRLFRSGACLVSLFQ